MSKEKKTLAKKVIYTGAIPQCPYCDKPTKRTKGMTTSTCVYYPPMYDENGNNTNPDRNTKTTNYNCMECGNDFIVKGNHTDGFTY